MKLIPYVSMYSPIFFFSAFCCLSKQRTKMQLHIRGNTNYVLEFATGNESLAELKAQKMFFCTLVANHLIVRWQSPALAKLTSMSQFHRRVVRFTVLWLVPVRFVVKLPKLKPEKRRRRKLDVLNVEFNITEDSLTLFKPSVADVDPTQIHKNMCFRNVHEKSCAP